MHLCILSHSEANDEESHGDSAGPAASMLGRMPLRVQVGWECEYMSSFRLQGKALSMVLTGQARTHEVLIPCRPTLENANALLEPLDGQDVLAKQKQLKLEAKAEATLPKPRGRPKTKGTAKARASAAAAATSNNKVTWLVCA